MRRAINYKHLHYFWAVARWGGITRAAERLHLTPQTLSGQVKQLEDSLGVALFRSAGKRLELTEAGRTAYSYADEMFSLGAELGDALAALPKGRAQSFRVGVADVVSKSLAQRLLAPVLAMPEPARLVCREGEFEALLAALALHRLDLVLSTRPIPPGLNVRGYSHRLGESGIGLYRVRSGRDTARSDFPRNVHGQPLMLPGTDSPLREALLTWCEARRIVPQVVAEFDDTALMKAFGAAGAGIFPAPLAVRGEIERQHDCVLLGTVDGLSEHYYAVSTERRVSLLAVKAVIEGAAHALAGRQPSKKPKRTG